MDGIWEHFLNIVREESGSRVVDTWFKALSLHSWDALEQVVYLKAPNQFVREWVQRNYMLLIQKHISRLLNVDTVRVVITEGQIPTPQKITQAVSTHELVVPATAAKDTSHIIPYRQSPSQPRIHAHYSFDDFVVGPNNSLAYAAAHAITEKPGYLYNPLFIYGGSGLGKTHLLHAIGNRIKELHKNAVILYQPTDRFVNEFIGAIRFDRVHKFQEKYRHVDVLLIDDIQFISNKEQTQEAFFHIFNALHESHKQIVFSGDTFPKNISGIADRLRSRLCQGLVADIVLPALETKIAIINKKAESHGVTLTDDIAHFIASCSVSSVRELEGSLVRVMAFASLTKQPITRDLVEKVLGHDSEYERSGNGLEVVIRCVKKYYSYGLEDLRSTKRSKELSYIRHITMFLMKRTTDKSLRDIGAFLGGRNHATVLHAINKIEDCIRTDNDLKQHIERMAREIVNF